MLGQPADDGVDRPGEPHAEEPVGFVEDQEFASLGFERGGAEHDVVEPAWGADESSRPGGCERADVLVDVGASHEEHGRCHAIERRHEGRGDVEDLLRELARGGDDDRADVMFAERLLPGRAREDLHQRQHERERLAAARARLDGDILVTREEADRRGLHRGGALESLRREHLQRLWPERRRQGAESRALRVALLGRILGGLRARSRHRARLEDVSRGPPGLN